MQCVSCLKIHGQEARPCSFLVLSLVWKLLRICAVNPASFKGKWSFLHLWHRTEPPGDGDEQKKTGRSERKLHLGENKVQLTIPEVGI